MHKLNDLSYSQLNNELQEIILDTPSSELSERLKKQYLEVRL